MDNLYLIAHKVRGQPAFDIAECCEDMGTATDPGPWWIASTWGFRAYPYWHCKINDLHLLDSGGAYGIISWNVVPPMPDDARDVFEIEYDNRRVSRHDLEEGKSLLLQLGLFKPKAPIARRGF